MKYIEITVITTTAASEIAAEILSEEGSVSGVSIVDRNDVWALKKEKAGWDYVEDSFLEGIGDYARVSGYFGLKDKKKAVRSIAARLEKLKEADCGIESGPLEVVTRVIDDGDWTDLWKKHFKPVTIRDITIVPEWLAGSAGLAGAVNQKRVILNPGIAFGTGEHETTAMCIELLQAVPLAGKAVIDLGCGSGILGITASVLGAAKVTMIDIDPLAAEASELNVKLNAQENPCVKNTEVLEGNLLERADIKADVIAANLASALLTGAAKEIAGHLNRDGILILSGIINSRADEVVKAYEEVLGKGAVKSVLNKGEWVALLIAKG